MRQQCLEHNTVYICQNCNTPKEFDELRYCIDNHFNKANICYSCDELRECILCRDILNKNEMTNEADFYVCDDCYGEYEDAY